MKRLIIFLCAAVLFATNSFAKVSEDNVVRVGFFESTGMFEGASDDAQKRGYCYDYMMHIATYTGWKLEFCYGSFAGLYEQLKNGEIDILPYTNYNAQRGKEVLFSEKALAIEEYYLAVKKGPGEPDSISAINGCTITTMTNADYNSLLFKFIADNGLKVNVNYFDYVEDIWTEMRGGKADATVYTSNSYSKDDWNCLCSFGKKPTYICVAKERADLLGQLNDAIDLIDKESPGYKESLYANYFSDNPVRKYLTEEEHAWINAHPVLHVGCLYRDFPSIFSYDEATHSATGLAVDIIEGIINRLDLDTKADYTCYESLEEMENALARGEIDVLFPFYNNPYVAQQHNLFISNVVREANMALVYKKGTSYQDALKKIAASKKRLGVNYIQDFFPDSEIIDSNNIAESVKKVRKGEATGAIAQSFRMQKAVEPYDNLNFIILSQGYGTCFATSPENYPLLRGLNRGLIYFSDAEILSLYSQYTLERRVSLKSFLATHKLVGVMAVIILLSLISLAIILVKVSSLKKKADAANNSKTTFLSSMSHDIRTPMNAIIGYTSMAKKYINDTERANDYLNKIGSASSNLLDLINQVLDMSRIESGKVVLSEDPVDVIDKAYEITEIFKPSAQAKNIKLTTVINQITDRKVYADCGRVNQLIINIIGNAIKYTPEGGSITYTASQVKCQEPGYATYVFSVKDTGLGISKKYIKEIFEPFSRENSTTVSKIQGTGLGMAIVKKLADLMGGKIDIDSEQGKGTTMSATLTFRLQEESAAAESKDEISAEPDFLKGKRVLLVEDNEMNREIATVILEEHGIIVETAEDGDIAVDKIKAIAGRKDWNYYDFVLMDIQMPKMTGYEAAKAIRAIPCPKGVHLPIIAMTANAFAEDRQLAIDAGMDEHIAKPIDVQVLWGTLARFI